MDSKPRPRTDRATRKGRGLACGVVIAVFALVAGAAHAEPTAADRETARTLMQDGRELRDRGDTNGALARFRAADDIMHVPTTGLEVARTEAALGLLIEARDAIAAIRKTPAKAADPEPFREARRKADELDIALEGRVPMLTIVVHAANRDGLTVSIDGVVIPAPTVGLPRSVDPGHHVIAAQTTDASATREVDVRESDRGQLELALTAAAAPAPLGPIASAPGPSAVFAPRRGAIDETMRPASPENRTRGPRASDIATYAGVGAASLGLVTGLVTGLLAWSQKSSLGGECPHLVCPPGSPSHDLDSANSLATASTVSFLVAGAGAGVAVTSLWMTRPRSASPRTGAASAFGASAAPWLGVGVAGVRGRF